MHDGLCPLCCVDCFPCSVFLAPASHDTLPSLSMWLQALSHPASAYIESKYFLASKDNHSNLHLLEMHPVASYLSKLATSNSIQTSSHPLCLTNKGRREGGNRTSSPFPSVNSFPIPFLIWSHLKKLSAFIGSSCHTSWTHFSLASLPIPVECLRYKSPAILYG